MLLRHGLIYIFARVLNSGLGFATTIGLTWILSPEAYGIYGLGLVAIALGWNMLFAWLVSSFLRKYQAQGHEPRFVTTVLACFAATCALSAILLGIASVVGLPANLQSEAWILLFGVWAYAWFEFAAQIQIVNFRPLRYLAMNLTRNIIVLAASLSVAYVVGSPGAVLLAGFVGMLLAGCLYLGDGTLRLHRTFDPALARAMLFYGIPMGFTGLCSSFAVAANRALLVWLVDARAVAFLTAASALVHGSIGIIGGGIGSATFPFAVREAESGNIIEAKRQLSRNFTFLIGILLPAAVGLSLLAPQVAHVLLQEEYRAPVTAMIPWLAAGATLQGIRAHYVDFAFQLAHRTWRLVEVAAITTAVSLALSYLLIPLWGALGAAIAMTIGVTASLAYAVWLSSRIYPLPFPAWDMCRVGVATLFMAVALLATPELPSGGGLALKLLVGGASYGIAALTLDLMGVRTAILGKFARKFANWRSPNARQKPDRPEGGASPTVQGGMQRGVPIE